ncbi:MAG: DUF4915 domain-containing protein [Flavobacteriaceae bacterium]|nr:DUF4915 domain-containing protein [Flavobacteriaceae bacterium]
MKLLVSFVNQVLTPNLKLCIIDTKTEEFMWIDKGIEDFGEGATGILVTNTNIYVCMQQSKLIVYDYSFEIKQVYDFKSVVDAHSMIIHDNCIYVVSSGTNEVYKLHYNGLGNIEKEVLFWGVENLSDYQKDYVHLNSITVANNELYVTMFGNKDETNSWSTDGKLVNINSKETTINIQQPHTAYNFQEEIIYCESKTGSLKNSKAKTLIQLDGYIRGITECQDYLYVASSARRKISKSKKKFLKGRMGGKEDVLTKCKINVIDKINMRIQKTIDMSAFANEIYDVAVLPKEVKIDFKSNLADVLIQINNSMEETALDKLFKYDQESEVVIQEKHFFEKQYHQQQKTIKNREVTISGKESLIEKQKQAMISMTKIKALFSPVKKYKAYKNLLKVINETKS